MHIEQAGNATFSAVMDALLSAPCKTTAMLKARVRADLKTYADAIAELQKHSTAALSALDEQSDFRRARQIAERTKVAYEVSRNKLDDHIAAHGCE